MHEENQSRLSFAVMPSIAALVMLFAGGVYYLRASSNPQSLVGTLLRGEVLPTADGSKPDWRESSLRPNEYRLTMDRVLDESDLMVVELKIETLQPQWYAIWSRGTTWVGPSGGHAVSGTIDQQRGPNEQYDNYYTGCDTLTAMQISYQDKKLARMSLGGGSTTMEVPLKTRLNRVLDITTKGGIYSLHEPIVIGSAFGVDVKLVVGDRTKVDAMAETFTDSTVVSVESE